MPGCEAVRLAEQFYVGEFGYGYVHSFAGMNPANMDADMFGQMAKHGDMKVPPCMPEDVANILLFLASDESRAITGQAIVSDFGSTL